MLLVIIILTTCTSHYVAAKTRQSNIGFDTNCEQLDYLSDHHESLSYKDEIDGDVWIAGALPMFTNESLWVNSDQGFLPFQALRFMIKKLNNQSALPGGRKFRLRNMLTVNTHREIYRYFEGCFRSNLPLIVGPISNEFTDQLDKLTEVFHVSILSLSSTSEEYELEKENRLGNHMIQNVDWSFQTSPAMAYSILAVRDLILSLEWNLIGLVSSSTYQSMVSAKFKETIRKAGICIKWFPNKIEKNIELMNKNEPRLKVLVLFLTQHDLRRYLKFIKKSKMQGRFVFVFALPSSLSSDIVNDYRDVLDGSFEIYLSYSEDLEFRDYFLQLTPEKEQTVYFHRYWEQVFQCRLESNLLDLHAHIFPRKNYSHTCNGTERFEVGKGYRYVPESTAAIKAMNLANVVYNDVAKEHTLTCNRTDTGLYKDYQHIPNCPWGKTKDFRSAFNHYFHRYTKNGRQIFLPWSLEDGLYARYDFIQLLYNRDNGNYSKIKVGEWQIPTPLHLPSSEIIQKFNPEFKIYRNRLTWREGAITKGKCSDDCGKGFIRLHDASPDIHFCCWTCQICPKNNRIVKNLCEPCQFDEMVDSNFSTCLKLPTLYIDLKKDILSIVVIGASVLGQLIVLLTVALFAVNNDKHIVRASGRDLSYSILTGVFILSVCPMLFIIRPTTSLCVLRKILPSLSMLICYAALFLKILRLYRIFIRGKERLSVQRQHFISPKSQLLILIACGFIQLIFSALFSFEQGIGVKKVLSENRKNVNLQCFGDELRFSFFIHSIIAYIFIFGCAMLAYIIRKLPSNYNESTHVALVTSCTTLIMVFFQIAYFLLPRGDGFLLEYAQCICFLAIVYSFIVCMFFSKVRILVQGKPFEEVHDPLRSRTSSKSPVKAFNFPLHSRTQSVCS